MYEQRIEYTSPPPAQYLVGLFFLGSGLRGAIVAVDEERGYVVADVECWVDGVGGELRFCPLSDVFDKIGAKDGWRLFNDKEVWEYACTKHFERMMNKRVSGVDTP